MSEKNPVRLAVIGAGAMGRNHIRFVTEEPEAELVAIADAFEGAHTAGVPCPWSSTVATTPSCRRQSRSSRAASWAASPSAPSTT